MSAIAPALSERHRRQLARAHELLETSNFTTSLADYAGKPLNGALLAAPKPLRVAMEGAIERAILQCLQVAVNSLRDTPKKPSSTRVASALAGVTGGISGLLGVAALPLELPATTILMLRAIAAIALRFGEDLSQLDARLACVEVFAYGAERRADVGYYASRALLGRISAEASALLLERGAANLSAPAVATLAGEVASRYSVVVWEKLAANAVPLLSAASAATINVAFMNHFQNVARGHFALRRLERIYGEEIVRQEYLRLSQASKTSGG